MRPALLTTCLGLLITSSPSTTECKKLTASDASAGDRFGFAVAVSGDTLVVGAPLSDETLANVGSAYVFTRQLGGDDYWGEAKKLLASNPVAGDQFGVAVSISGDTAVVGAYQDDEAATNSGAAYVFERNRGGADNWGEVRKLIASDAAADDALGWSVSISGDLAVVGAYQDDGSTGSAYVFARNQGGPDNWGEVKKLTPSGGNAGQQFAYSVSISGDTVVVGARYYDGPLDTKQGAAYVFERDQGGTDNWGEVKRLTATNPDDGDEFGSSVSISGDTAVVGAPSAPSLDQGTAYVFVRDKGGADNWGRVKQLATSIPQLPNGFGFTVAIDGDTVVIGARSGQAYVFARNRGGPDYWGETRELLPSSGATGDRFGDHVAVSGDTSVVGADQDADGGTNSGAAYVFHELWLDIGLGLAGTDGTPVLEGTGSLLAREPVSLTLSSARPSSPAVLVIGASRIDFPFFGGTLVPLPGTVLSGSTDATGTFVVNANWPRGQARCAASYFQVWIVDPGAVLGLSASNALCARAQQ